MCFAVQYMSRVAGVKHLVAGDDELCLLDEILSQEVHNTLAYPLTEHFGSRAYTLALLSSHLHKQILVSHKFK